MADEVEALIDELGLEFFGKVEKVEMDEDLSLMSHVNCEMEQENRQKMMRFFTSHFRFVSFFVSFSSKILIFD